MSLPKSSSSVFSGYHPIEVTHNDYRRTVGYSVEEEDEVEGKNCMSPPKSMTKRIGNIFMTPLHKKKSDCKTNNKNVERTNNILKRDTSPPRSQCGSSISGFSNQGQQSVANKTVDSQATLKVSNIHQEDASLLNNSSKEVHGNVSSFLNSSQIQSKTWKTLKRLVKGQAPKTQNPHPSTEYHQQRKHATSYDGAQAILGSAWKQEQSKSSSSLLNDAYPIRKRIVSDEGRRQYPGCHSTPTTSRETKNILSRRAPSSSVSVSAVTSKEELTHRNVTFSGVASVPGNTEHRGRRRQIDHAIRGRLDGVDIISLGPVSRSTLPPLSETARKNRDKKSSSPFAFAQKDSDGACYGGTDSDGKYAVDPLCISFTDLPSTASPADLVYDMIWTSAGREQTEIVLEGFIPGGSDRWTVIISPEENMSSSGSHQSYANDSHGPPALQSTTDDDESTTLSSYATEDGSLNLPANVLWNNLWGNKPTTTPPIPSHMQTAPTKDQWEGSKHASVILDEEEEVLKFASSCNVPYDLDEDAFIVDNPDHVRSVHELAMISLQSRHFDSSISIFQKLLRGLKDSNKFEHLIGSTYHNVGMIHLLRARYSDAMRSFDKALQARKKSLPSNHPDIAVSIQRKGIAYFALSAFNKAESCFEDALEYYPENDAARAKILNNVGIVRYQLQDYNKSLKSFTAALELQRQWLEGPVRRKSLAYDASITLANMGKVYLRKGDYDLAYFVFEEACLMQTSFFRKDHELVLTTLDSMARVHAKNGNQAEALRMFTSLVRSQEARYGSESEACIETLGMKGIVHLKLLEFEEAMECINRVAKWQKTHLSFCHPAIRTTKEKIKQIQRCLKGEEELWV